MVPPRNIILEVSNQLLRRCENVGVFLSFEMPVIALPSLIVISQNAFAKHDIWDRWRR